MAGRGIVEDSGVVPCGDALGADAPGGADQLIKLDLRVAETARDGGFPGQVAFDEGADDLLLEALLEIDYVVRNTQKFRHPPRVINIIQRAATAARDLIGGSDGGQTPLVPKLHGKADDRLLIGEQGGRHRAVQPATHGHGQGWRI